MRSYLLTLGDTNAHNLLTLIQAVDTAFQRVSGYSSILFQADVGNTSSQYVAVGTDSLTSSNYSFKMGPGVFSPLLQEGGGINGISIADFYLIATNANLKVGVLIMD